MKSSQATETELLPEGRMYQSIRVLGVKLPYYASPIFQIILLSVTCFLCPGMYNALTGLGGGGQLDADVANKAIVALYSAFASVSFFAGSFCNVLGVQKTFFLGSLGYPLFVASFLAYNYTKNEPFVIFSGAVLGICAALLWTAQGAMMMAYADENRKGHFIAIFWAIFNAGAVIGSFVPLIQNLDSKADAVGNGTYIGFLCLTLTGACMALTLCKTDRVLRPDGSKIVCAKQESWKTGILGVWKVLRWQPAFILLFPLFFVSNWFYTYQFNDVNLARFNIRTRSLNNLMYWLAQIIAAYGFGSLLDMSRFKRHTRALGGLGFLFLATMVIWGCGYDFQNGYTRESVQSGRTKLMDWTDSGYAGAFILYWFYGMFDALWQTYVYWLMGALTNSAGRLAYFAGMYKSLQSAGAAITYQLDSWETPYMTLLISNWVLLGTSLVIALPVAYFKVSEHSERDEISDEVELSAKLDSNTWSNTPRNSHMSK